MKSKVYKIEVLRGKMFGFLEVIDEVEMRKGNRYVKCKCHRCGREKEICLSSLIRGITTSCGCGHRNELIGKRFGHLEVIDYVAKRGKRTFWLCKCDCGNIKEIEGYPMVRGRILSCGCLCKKTGIESRTYKHGLTHCRIMKIWGGMKDRCYNPKNDSYKNYGGRGISVCDEWKNDLQRFWEWSLNNGYKDDLTIDRIDVNGNYDPSNCRWVDRKTQCNNQRNNHYIDYNGEQLTISQLGEKLCIPPHCISNRLYSGWSLEKAINTPYKKRNKKNNV